MDFGDDLIKRFINSIADLSYYEAAEGDQYFKEAVERERSRSEFTSLKIQMVAKYGKRQTLEVLNSTPHLLLGEAISLEKGL